MGKISILLVKHPRIGKIRILSLNLETAQKPSIFCCFYHCQAGPDFVVFIIVRLVQILLFLSLSGWSRFCCFYHCQAGPDFVVFTIVVCLSLCLSALPSICLSGIYFVHLSPLQVMQPTSLHLLLGNMF